MSRWSDNYPEPWTVREWETQGLRCYVMAHPMGHLCGYVEVPEEHPVTGLSYDDVSNAVSVHGDLTYREGLVYGFDTAHGFDYWSDEAIKEYGGDPTNDIVRRRINGPIMEEFVGTLHRFKYEMPRHDWTLDKVVEETTALAIQLAEIRVPDDPAEITETAE